ncbi:MAG: histidinol-phosphate transaminase [Ktedonobacterales bacterium]
MQRVNGIVQVRPEIAGIEDYIPGESLEAFSARTGVPADRLIKLNSNESPYPPSPRVARAFGAFENYNLYPDPDGRALTADISAYVGVAPEHIVLSSGSNELITKLWSAFLTPGESVLLCSPTFSLYTTATTLANATIVDAPRTDDYDIDARAIRAALREDTKLIVLCSPNNPTGNLVARADVEALLDTGRIVVVDEAYIEFAGAEALAQSPITLVPQYQNLVVLRTFSKWAGLAGLRLGYGAFPTWLTTHIRKLQLPFEVNLAAHIAAHETLADLPLMRGRVATLLEERDRLFELLRAQPYLRAFPSKGNFILAELTDPRLTLADLRASMEAAGIILRYFRTPDLVRHVRITVGTAEHTAALARVLENIGARLVSAPDPMMSAVAR